MLLSDRPNLEVQLIFCFRNEIINYTQSGIKAARTDAAEVSTRAPPTALHVTAHLLINFSFSKDRTQFRTESLKVFVFKLKLKYL